MIPVEYLATTEELTKLANSYQEEAVIKLTQNGSNVTGRLASSMKVLPARVTETSIRIPVSMLQYGIYVDNGAERGRGKQPPIQDIKDWIQQKRISIPSGFSIDYLRIVRINHYRTGTTQHYSINCTS